MTGTRRTISLDQLDVVAGDETALAVELRLPPVAVLADDGEHLARLEAQFGRGLSVEGVQSTR